MTQAPTPLSRRTFIGGLSAAGLGTAAGVGLSSSAPSWGVRSQPNVIYVSIDDLAWKELGCYGNTFNETPHIDRLASQGIRFTDAYAAASICSPTRAALMTGLYPANTGITDYLREQPAPSESFLAPGVPTIPGTIGEAGYASALVGKWHLTERYSGEYAARPGNPYAHGFDEVRASETRYIAGGDYSHPYAFMPELPGTEGEYLTDRLAQEAVDFITAHRDQPFFMHLSNYAVHTTLSAKPELLAKYRDKPGAGENGNNPALAAMLESIDDQVGAVVAALEELDLVDDTLIMVMSDNGGDPNVTTNAPLRGHKSQLYEGGIRVALVASWPAVVAPGRVSDVPVSTVDVFPTVLDLAGTGAGLARTLDGESLLPLLEDSGGLARDALFWVYPHFHFLGAVPQAAVRSGRYKLIESLKDGRVELYDLEDDLGEQTDLAEQLPETTAALRTLLAAHLEETGVLAAPPSVETYPEVDLVDDFAGDASAYTVLTRPGGADAAEVGVAGGALTLTGGSEDLTLLRSDVAPGGPEPVAMSVEMRSFAEAGGTQDTLFVGLVKDADNLVLVWHNRARGRTGWDAVVDGALVTRAGAEPLAALEGDVDLSAPGSRLTVVLEGTTFTAYADAGNGWEYLFQVDLGEVLDLTDPAVRAEYRYGFGARLNAGTMAIERVEARRRTAPRAEPLLRLIDDRLDADERTVEVGVTAGGRPVVGGTVTLREGGRTLGSAVVTRGLARVLLPRPLPEGAHRLVASYSGNAEVTPATATLRLVVERPVRRRSRVTARPRRRSLPLGRRFRIDVRVRAGAPAATGQVQVLHRGRVVARGRLRRDGTAVLTWRARRPYGRQTYRVRYLGSRQVTPSSTDLTVRVERSRNRR